MSLQIQRRFAGGLLNPGQAAPAGLATQTGVLSQGRYAVYQNNVMSGLIGALASRFPVAERIVGPAFFAGMASAYIMKHPPRSPVLLHYGDDLAAFAETFEPAASVLYLGDIIRLEAARGRAYHAADAVAIEPAALAGFAGERLAELTMTFHPAASIIRSRFPIVTIWAMNVGEVELVALESWSGEDALVTRPALTVRVQRLPAGGAAFLSGLLRGASLGAAAALALEASAQFDLTTNIAGLLEGGLVTAVH